MNVVINGDFFDHPITGVQRYAIEIIKELDAISEKENNINFQLVVPKNLKNVPSLKNIPVVKYKKYRKIFWLQYDLMRYCQRKNALCLCLCTVVPYFYSHHSIEVVHDAATLAHPEFYSRSFILMNKIFLWHRLSKLAGIITVSKFSKNEILKYTHILNKKILVAYNSYEHIYKVKADYHVFKKYPVLLRHGYFYSLSSLAPNKNFQWILAEARKNSNELFIITGMKIKLFSKSDLENIPKNVVLTGYLSDGEVKALMQECKTFLFPTFYEGFGIPPLEALACGAKITVSDTSCMHEIYGSCPTYIDPDKTDYIASQFLGSNTNYRKILNRYSWKRTAMEIFRYLKKF